MMATVRDLGRGTSRLARRAGAGTAALATRVGSNTAAIGRRIGPKRGLIGLAVVGAAVGGSIALVRYLRRRDAAQAAELGGGEAPATMHGARVGHQSRAKRKAARAERAAARAGQTY